VSTLHPDDTQTPEPVTTRARLVLWPLVAVVLVHTLLIALWVGPDTPVRKTVGEDRLRSYVMPAFEQNWRIFAPTPRRVAVELDVRARLVDPATGQETTTDWVSLVDGEDSLIRGNPFPPRMALAARRTANHLVTRTRELNAEQRRQIEADYLTTPVAELRDRLNRGQGDSPAGPSTVNAYLRYDAVATALATSYAAAAHDGEVTHVQYRTSRRFTPDFDERHERDIDDVEPTVYAYGWRPASELGEETAELFAPYVRVQQEATR